MEKKPVTWITPELLHELGACEYGIDKFQWWLQSHGWTRARITARNLRKAVDAGLDVDWLYTTLPSWVPRDISLALPRTAYLHAVYIDHGSRDDTRIAACGDPASAYLYALKVDRCPRDDTRAAACGDPHYAYCYAHNVDRCPRDDTRAAACGELLLAYQYAREVDRGPHPQTWAAVQPDSCFRRSYVYWLGKPKEAE